MIKIYSLLVSPDANLITYSKDRIGVDIDHYDLDTFEARVGCNFTVAQASHLMFLSILPPLTRDPFFTIWLASQVRKRKMQRSIGV